MASEFGSRIGVALGGETLYLPTASVNIVTRNLYMSRCRRWARFCTCMGASPWLVSTQVGWRNAPNDILVWRYKLLGIKNRTLARIFFEIRFVHTAEVFGDLSIRSRRAKSAIKEVKLRGNTREKAPPNTDLIRWLHSALGVDTFGWKSNRPTIYARVF